MKSYLIGYDLNKTGQDYETLIEQIKKTRHLVALSRQYLDNKIRFNCSSD